MSISSIVGIIFILIVDIILIRIDLKNKLIISGINIYKILMPVIVIIFIICRVLAKDFKAEDIAILVGILPLAFIGNKSGITERGILNNSHVFVWNKIESYSLEERKNKYILYYKTKAGMKKVFFKEKDKEEVKKYLQGKRELKYVRK